MSAAWPEITEKETARTSRYLLCRRGRRPWGARGLTRLFAAVHVYNNSVAPRDGAAACTTAREARYIELPEGGKRAAMNRLTRVLGVPVWAPFNALHTGVCVGCWRHVSEALGAKSRLS